MRKTVFAQSAMSVCLVSMMLMSPVAALAANKPQYLPAIAPKLDPSGFVQPVTSAPRTAPSYSSANDDDGASLTPIASQPARTGQTDPDERIKNMLREALQKHNQGDINGAKQLFKKVLSADPRNADANFNLGAMAEDAGDLNAAQNYYKAASLANPNDPDVRDALSTVNQKMAAKAQEQQTAMALDKKNQLRGMANQAAAAYKAGQYDKAISILQQIDSQAPNDPNVKYGLGQAYRGKGDMRNAVASLSAAASLDPNNQLYKSTLSDTQRQASNSQVASGPRTAPSYGGGNSNDGLPSGMKDYGQPDDGGAPQQIADNDPSPAGQITPFTDQGDPNAGRLFGHAYGNGPRGITIGSGGLGGLGGLGLGALAGGLGSMVMGGGRMMGGGMGGAYNGYGMPYQSRGTRLVRGAVTGSLAGAAIGAMTGMGRGSAGMRSGAMRGAMMGGLFGMLSGF